jgi:CheY-like chemotaxis protein
MDSTRPPNRIILAEDNLADVGLVREALREYNVSHELRVIADGGEALAFIDLLNRDSKVPCPDLLLLDLHLPKHDGSEILRHFRASQRCGQTPVVVLTSSDSTWGRQDAERDAATHYFRKPILLDQFMQLGRIVKEVISHGR